MRGAFIVLLAMGLLTATHLRAQLDPATAQSIDSLVAKGLADTATPSVSLAVVKEGKMAHVKAYGNARLSPLHPCPSRNALPDRFR
jgi:CubicO group peptidase (beta-lactamase class C family)